MISTNIKNLRKKLRLSQEELAEKVGVARQTVAKWENGDALPDIISCKKLSMIFKVSIDDLLKTPVGEKGEEAQRKHIFGAVTVGERGQIVIPAKAREIFDIKPGDKVLILGDVSQGMAMVKLEWFSGLAEAFHPQAEEYNEGG